jgi:DNA modification methylase
VPNAEIESSEHPTSKPNRLFAIPMELHTRPDDLCYEPFSGNGSQLIAAEQLGRRSYAIELEPRFVDVAISRWERLTGKKAELIADVCGEGTG